MIHSIFSRRLTAGLLGLSLLFAPALGGCAAAGQAASTGFTESYSAPAGQDSGAVARELFPAGTWLSDQGQFYFFDSEANSGRTVSLKDGMGAPFSYTFDGSQAAFVLDTAGGSLNCDITVKGDTITLRWESGTVETLTFFSSQGSDTFRFYCDDELCQLALAYYQAQNPGEDTQSLTAAAQTNEDGTVTVQVYRNLTDHNSTAAWYTVDRFTAQGTEASSGAAVDLDG